MAAYHQGWLKKLPEGWLPVHQDQFLAQRSVTSMGELYLFTSVVRWVSVYGGWMLIVLLAVWSISLQYRMYCSLIVALSTVQCAEVHATCCAEADGKHANALGTDSWCRGPLSHHRCYHICEWDPMGYWASLHRPVGVCESDSMFFFSFCNKSLHMAIIQCVLCM